MGQKKPRKPGTCGNRFTESRKEIYLAELRRTGLKPDACKATNVTRVTVSRHREKDPDFAEAELQAMITYRRLIEDEIQRRGIEGVARPVYQGGEKVGSIRDYSDALLIRLAKRHIPEYRDSIKVDQRTEHSGSLALEADLSKLDARGRSLLRDLLQCEIAEDEDDDDVPEEEADGVEAE